MVRMIPSEIAADAPDSERAIFARLGREPGTDHWVGLHSLGLSNAYSGQYGEIDFVLLIPEFGVVCLEVKGGRVSQTAGVWGTVDRHGTPSEYKRSPFEQVRSAMFKLLQAIKQHFGQKSAEARCPMGWLVAFPDVDCPPVTPEFTRGDVLDRSDLRDALSGLILRAPSVRTEIGRNGRVPPNTAVVQRLQTFLRPDFDRVPTAASTLGPVQEALHALTEEQYLYLDTAMANDKALVVGPAGTGKTTLALEQARRLSAEGKSVLLLCFNRTLGAWLHKRTREWGPGRIIAGSAHQLIRAKIAQSPWSREFAKLDSSAAGFWTETFFLYGALALDSAGERFDSILVDEAQDFEPTSLIAFCEHTLAPGGQLTLFGDFERQALYGLAEGGREAVRARLGSATVVPLTRNCRNTRRIAGQTSLLTGFSGIKLHIRQPEGAPVETVFFGSASEQKRQLERLIGRLAREGVSASDVIVLGPNRKERSSLANLEVLGPWRLIDAEDDHDLEGLRYCTIHSFKGMEAPIIVIIDLAQLDGPEAESLLYVAMSRARALLFMFINQHCRDEFDRRVTSALALELGQAR